MATKAQVLARLARLPDDEPLFLLEGHDRLASGLVRYWAGAARAKGAREQKVTEAQACADEMQRYPKRKYPD